MDIRRIDPNLLRTAPIGEVKPKEEQVEFAKETKEEATPFEDILSKLIDEKMEEQAKIDKGIVDSTTAAQMSSQAKMSMMDGFNRSGERSDWNPAGLG